MEIFKKTKDVLAFTNQARGNQKTVGFVPTMGALHAGHISLIHRALKENDVVVCSIFVNPTQFNNPEDLEKYPRNVEADIQLLEEAGCHAVFLPEVSEMYPKNVESDNFDFGGLDTEMEGKFRPGHFQGVGTIVKKLFLAVNPNKAYFGEKDYQQLLIIKKMVELEGLDVKVVPCEIKRESSGLAMSSRNARLSDNAFNASTLIHEQLIWMLDHFNELSVSELKQAVEMAFDENDAFELEYVEVTDGKTLKPIQDRRASTEPRAFISAYIEGVRLIDNMKLS